jgi:TonB family protein
MTSPAWCAAATLLIGAIHTAEAQVSPARPDTTVVPWSAITERPRLRDAAPAAGIHFPDILRSARVGGNVQLEVVVGADGQPERSNIRVVSSTHDLFTIAARNAVRQWRMSQPMLDGRPVRATIPVAVSFVLPEEREEASREVAAVVIDSTGFHISLGRERVPPQVGLVANPADSRAATVAVLAELLSVTRPIVAGAMCVRWNDSTASVPTDVLESLRATIPDVRDPAHCPPTYASMILRVDSLGKPLGSPTGAPDPVWISASRVRPWTTDLYAMNGVVSQGTLTRRYHCDARRERLGAPWTATREPTATSVGFRLGHAANSYQVSLTR